MCTYLRHPQRTEGCFHLFLQGYTLLWLLGQLITLGGSLAESKVGVLCDLAEPDIDLTTAIELIDGAQCFEECLLCDLLSEMFVPCQR